MEINSALMAVGAEHSGAHVLHLNLWLSVSLLSTLAVTLKPFLLSVQTIMEMHVVDVLCQSKHIRRYACRLPSVLIPDLRIIKQSTADLRSILISGPICPFFLFALGLLIFSDVALYIL